MANILFVVAFPVKMHSSSRFRIEIYERTLLDAGHTFRFANFWSEKAFNTIYKPGKSLLKIALLIWGILRRFVLLFNLGRYNYIFILREAAPLGPPLFEWICAKILRKKIIYDFDDAIWIRDKSENNRLAALVKANWKVSSICRWAFKVSAGNQYLFDYAKQFNQNVILNPTCVDTDNVHNQMVDQLPVYKRVCIGWTGSFSTLRFLEAIVPLLQEIDSRYDLDFVVIADKDPALPLKNYRFVPWREETEINDLLQLHIGLMPLSDDLFSEGKCGFKLIQYMALGMPVAASPVGVNKHMIENGKNGYLCRSNEDWLAAVQQLMEDPQLRTNMGKLGRQTVVEQYSVQANAANFLKLFTA